MVESTSSGAEIVGDEAGVLLVGKKRRRRRRRLVYGGMLTAEEGR